MSAITTNGNLIHYEVLGRGRPVILVHGWVGSWRYWIPTMQVLQLKYRVYALDLYGFGDTAKNPQHYALDQQIALLDEFMQQLGIPKAALIGHGLGALIVGEFARRFPDRVPRLLIADGPLFDPGDLNQRAERKAVPTRSAVPDTGTSAANTVILSAGAAMRAALAEATRARSAPAAEAQAKTENITRADPAPVPGAAPVAEPKHNPLLALMDSPEALLARCFRRSEASYEKLSVDLLKTDAPVLRKSVETFDAGRMLDTLRVLTAPVLIIHGGEEPLIPQPSEDVLNYLTFEKENSLLAILLPNVRHFPMLEDDRFARLASDFLEAPDISRLEIKERWRRRTR